MKIGVPKEIREGENRVSLIPQSVKKIIKSGLEVVIEAGAGEKSSFSDKDFEDVGASIASSAKDIYEGCDLVVKINKPEDSEIEMMKSGLLLISVLQPLVNQETVKKLLSKNVTTFSLDSVPRITRAQSMDILSSMATVAGYKAVLIGANSLNKLMPMLMTAAGTLRPAGVFVIGAGVAGLQAIATARRLGANVSAIDIRPVVEEQVKSLGAKFVKVELEGESTETAGGYAKEVSDKLNEKLLSLISDNAKKMDIIISTAQIPGRKAPILLSEETVKSMPNGSVVIDLAIEGGGNCELSERGKQVVKHGVSICAYENLPSMVPLHASQMFAKNMENVIGHLAVDGKLNLDFEDEITKSSIITHGGEIVNERVKELIASKV